MSAPGTCPECGAELGGAPLCPRCGWDPALEHRRPRRRRLGPALARAALYGGLAALLAAAWMRWATVGPGPDLPTTLRWLALGDGGRAAELVTLNREYEIARAAARWGLENLEAPSFGPGWAARLEPFSTAAVRGWLPLLFAAADARLAPGSVREMYAIRETDGWGRPFAVRTRPIPRGADPERDPEVAADLAAGLRRSIFRRARTRLAGRDWLRLEIASSGADGRPGTADDVVFVAYVPVSHTFRVGADAERLRRELESAYLQGFHLFRVASSRYDLIAARLLAEHRLEAFTGE